MAEYPRLVHLDEDTKARLISYLKEELFNHRAERGPYIERYERWQRDYWAEPTTEVRTFPFRGASNIIIPLTAIAVEAVNARMITMLFAVDPMVSVKLKMDGLPPDADPSLERYMDHVLKNEVKARRPIEDFILETTKFGTGTGKSGYEKIQRKAIRTVGDTEIEFPVTIRDGPTLEVIAGPRFLMPFTSQDPQLAPWVGEEHSISPYEVLIHQNSGMFYEGIYDDLAAFFMAATGATDMNSGQDATQNQEALERKVPVFPRRIDFDELWLGFDIDQDKEDEEIQVLYHEQSEKLLAVRHNWRDDLSRPYKYANYIRVEHRWAGIGICKQNEQFQRESTTIHRQRLDNATIANMRMFVVHKMSGYGPKEPIFPGKMWFVDDMTHVSAIQMGEVYQSSFANEQAVMLISQQRSGVNEVTLGMPTVGTPGTATGDLARIQEGNKKFDYAMDNIKHALGELFMDVFLNIKRFGSRDADYYQTAPGGQVVQQILSAPIDVIRRGLIFELGATNSRSNRLVDRQSFAQITTIMQQYFVSLLQLSQGNPQLTTVILRKGLLAANEVTRQLLETFEIRNIDRILVTEIDQLLNQEGGNGIQPAVQRFSKVLGAGGSNPPNGNGSTLGMDTIQEIARAVTESRQG